MMKLGEAAGRLAPAEVEPPPGMVWTDAVANRNWLIHQYDKIDRALTWVTCRATSPVDEWRSPTPSGSPKSPIHTPIDHS